MDGGKGRPHVLRVCRRCRRSQVLLVGRIHGDQQELVLAPYRPAAALRPSVSSCECVCVPRRP